MKHATIQAIWQIWTGWQWHIEGVCWDQVPIGRRACASQIHDKDAIGGADGFKEIPTCPACAVLYDEAMAAREELLGRREAACS